MPDYIGLDIGGTNIRVGAIDADEKIIYSYKELTFSGVNNEKDLYNKIKRLVELVPNYNNAKKIGISVAGSVDLKSNNIITSKNLNMLINYPLKNKLEKDYNKEFTIKDVYEKLDNKVGLTTIYRFVDKLVDDNTLSKTINKDNVTYYQYLEKCNHENHFYLKCDKCGGMIHIDCDCIRELSDHIYKKHHFISSRDHIIISGLCNNCLNKGGN